MAAQAEKRAIQGAAASVRWWPAAAAFLVLGVGYALVSDRLRLGPSWALLALAIVAVAGAHVLRWRGMHSATRWLAFGSLVVVTAAITASVAFLVGSLLNRNADPSELLRGGALIWVSNILTFGLWYWEIDGGGPAHRHATHCGSTDFAFPQKVLGGADEQGWMPDFLDYVFLAFNTNTAFSPTDTMVLARRAKAMMMYQSVLALVTVAVLVARAINAL